MADRDVLAHFDERAEEWNRLYARASFRDRLRLFVDGVKAAAPPGSRVLDFGCGAGRIAVELAASGYVVDGVDGSRGMIEQARREGGRRGDLPASFAVIDPASWRAEGRYAAVVCSSVLEYVQDDEALLARLCASLAPGGVLLISLPCAASLVGRLEDLLLSARALLFNRSRDVHFAQRRYDRAVFEQILERHGMGKPSWTSFEFPRLGKLGVLLSRSPYIGVMALASARRSPSGSPG